jgi:3-dehydroquinate dehydratase-1
MIKITKSHRSLKPDHSYKGIVRLMKGRPIICTTITASKAGEFVNMTAAAAKLGTDMAELRIDYLKNHDPKDIKKIITKSQLPLIATLRSKDEGGIFPSGNEKKRISLLYEIIECGPAFIDIEFSINEKQRTELIAIAHDKGVGVICSYHDFKNTPPSKEIINIFKKVSKTGTDVVKLVFTPHTAKDVNNILDSVRLARSDIPSTIFGMGKAGQPTRILSPVLGSCLTYCAVKVNPASNLAQISVKNTRSIFDSLSKKKSWAAIRREPKSLTLDISRFMSNHD